jgi:hypothetical protein
MLSIFETLRVLQPLSSGGTNKHTADTFGLNLRSAMSCPRGLFRGQRSFLHLLFRFRAVYFNLG